MSPAPILRTTMDSKFGERDRSREPKIECDIANDDFGIRDEMLQ